MTDTERDPTTIAGFVDLLRLKELDENHFHGWCHAGAKMRAFGGQVAAQALVAAGRTVPEGRGVHSLHGYFMRPGDPTRPLTYAVDRLRDGRSFSTRHVTALQDDTAVFTLSASFKPPEESAGRQRAMPGVPPPEALPDPSDAWSGEASQGYWGAVGRYTFDMRFAPEPSGEVTDPGTTRQYVWLRTAQRLPEDDPLLHVCALAYLSDLNLASTAALHVRPPRHLRGGPSRVAVASLDHAMWFHRPFRADDWLLFAQSSPTAGDGRGLAHSDIFTHDGRLVASVTQEVLIRHRPRPGG
ncbi:acyl-CoA thioesterase domain-containing protein [Streptomyces sp. NPDC051840]|uniref:acyl-CoA thioesterase n=1 Tax=unclassified Streptomyces TaxID=2593676 RepID=UPI0034279746